MIFRTEVSNQTDFVFNFKFVEFFSTSIQNSRSLFWVRFSLRKNDLFVILRKCSLVDFGIFNGQGHKFWEGNGK